MNITTATPAEIDTVLADLYEREWEAAYERDRQIKWAEDIEEGVRKFREENARQYSGWKQESADQCRAKADAQQAIIDSLVAEALPLHNEYTRRGGWTRVYLATSSTQPHAHRGMDCPTCNKMGKATKFGWLPEYSGKPEAEIVADAGERACTTCYPTAPVGTLSRPTKMFTADEKTKAEAKAERDAKRAAAEAEKITVDGFRESTVFERETTKEFKTLRAATQAASSARADVLTWGGNHPSVPVWEQNAERVEAAIAAKTGTPLADVKADIAKRAAATHKRRG